MATEMRHAAWQYEKRFAVRLLPEEGPGTELVSGLDDFLDAVDFAVEWLAREDPDRTGTARLAIFESSDDAEEKVWAYPPDGPADSTPLMKIFGFDPVSWKPAGAEFAPGGPAKGTFFARALETAPPVDSRTVRARTAARVLPSAPVATVVPAAVEAPPVPQPLRLPFEPRRALAAAWADRLSRACLILAGVTLWLSLALAAPGFLVLLVVPLVGLWWRRDKLLGAAETDAEDWL